MMLLLTTHNKSINVDDRYNFRENGIIYRLEWVFFCFISYGVPYDIATEFKIDMSFTKDEIAVMLQEYEADYQTGMNVHEIAGLICNPAIYSSIYRFLAE